MSLRLALQELLGGPCYHMEVVIRDRPDHIPLWRAVARGESMDWGKLFEDFEAAVDWPAARFYRELAERFPEAKVILTVRDPGGWYDSLRATIYRMTEVSSSFPANLMLGLGGPRRHMTAMGREVVWDDPETFAGSFPDREGGIAVFEQHLERVKQAIPPERLLVYNVAEGWEPLCRFLDLPVPETPFPNVNDKREFIARIRIIQRASYAFLGVLMALVGGGLWALL